jgi:hypothetical protein
MTTARGRYWITAWIGAAALGVANGASREALYADAVGDEAAHLISTGTLLALLGGYMRLLQRRWPLGTRREAVSIGAAWAVLTVAFEFGFGHWVAGDSWSALLENYDVTERKVWVLVPGAMAAGPELARRLVRPGARTGVRDHPVLKRRWAGASATQSGRRLRRS